MRKQVNIITGSLVLLLLISWYFDFISLLILIPIMAIYLVVLIIGSTKIQLKYFIKSHCKGETDKKEIAITFDDGPDPVTTPELLDLFDEKGVNATFFCLGKKVSDNGDLIQRMINSGHIIGNHTFYHSKYFDLFSSYRMVNEINCTNNEIYKITGKFPILFRPPYGVTNPLLKKAIRKTGMTSIGWSLRSLDTVKDTEEVYKKLISKTSAGDIVLFHDNIHGVANLLNRYLNWLDENDFSVVNLTQLLNIPAYEN